MNDPAPVQQTGEGTVENRNSKSDFTRKPAFWPVVGAISVSLLSVVFFGSVLRSGITSSVPTSTTSSFAIDSDIVFEAWLVARNARTMLYDPLDLYEAEHCAPHDRALTFGIPMITMGMLATPVALFTPNPALAYNFSILMLGLAAALGMYLLVRDWTGIPAAGIVAGLLYAFAPIRLGFNVVHPSVWDSAWLVFALYFARRLFVTGRWRDCVGLAIACVLQMTASFYPFLASVLFTPAFAGWLFHRYGMEHVRIQHLAFLAVVLAGSAALFLGPYLTSRSEGMLPPRELYFYASPELFLPGGLLFFGFGLLAMAAIGMLAPRRVLTPLSGDPRWILLASAVFVVVVAMGPFLGLILSGVLPESWVGGANLHSALLQVIPGLDSIRVVSRFSVVLQVTVGIFAGVGAAWLIGLSGERSTWAGLSLIGLAAVSTTQGLATGLPRSIEVSVAPEEIEFYRELAEIGNEGPLLEIPIQPGIANSLRSPNRILANAYHLRRTSACFSSYYPESTLEFAELANSLPNRKAESDLYEMGFTTLIVHHDTNLEVALWARRMSPDGEANVPPILLASARRTAYALRPAGTDVE